MATKRSVRGKKSNVVYKDESSSDSENEEDPQIKKAKMKLKELVNDDDSGSDFERELKTEKKKTRYQSSDDEEEVVVDEADTKRKTQSKSNLKSKIEKSTHKLLTKTKITPASNFDSIFKKRKISTEKLLSKTSINPSCKSVNLFETVKMPRKKIEFQKISLSESDSSDDESVEKRQVFKANSKIPSKSLDVAQTKDDAFDAQDDMVANDKLLALAGNLDKINNAWKEDPAQLKQTEEETPSSSKKKRPKNSKKPEICNDDFDISKILAQGEGVADNDLQSDDDNTSEDAKSPVKSQKSIEINIALPETRKRKKKGFDLSAYLKRELSKGRRELQVVLHQSHYLCLVGHLRYLSLALADPVMQSVALSLVPAAHSHSPPNLTLPRLQGLVSWLRDALPITKDNIGALPVPLQSSMLKKLEHFVVSNEVEMVLVFVLICRALGYDARLVLNCTVVSMKPPTVKEDNVEVPVETHKKKETSAVQKSKKKKCSKACSDDEGEEFPKQKTKAKSSSSSLAAAAGKRASRVNHKSRGKGSAEQREADLLKSLEKKHKGESREEFNQKTIDKLTKKKAKDGDKADESSKKIMTKNKSKEVKPGLDYWCEVFLGKWVTVDIVNGKSNCATEMEGRATKPVTYVLADNGVGIKDVTRRYAANYMTQTRKIRCTQEWLDDALHGITIPNDAKNEWEDKDLDKNLHAAPMPTTVSAFKDHPLYALERHLLKFEAIYPPNSVTLGFIKSSPVYARECVHTLNGRTAWLKEGRTVILNQEPYKVVKARPKWDRMTGNVTKDEPLELFGKWQTELYVPPPVENGKVPRNEYGNVELFKPWMLPIGCVHLPINTLRGTARRLDIDAAPAMIGWDFSAGGSHPVYDGYVVVADRAEELMDAWNKDQAEKEERQREKREARVLGNWKRIVKGLFIKQRIQAKYMDQV